MVGVLVLTHGCLGQEILAAAETIAGALPHATAICLDWHEDVEAARTRIADAVESLDQGEGVLILTDIYGGTPARIAESLRSSGKVEVVTGVNLAMLVKLGCLIAQPVDAAGLADVLVRKGRTSIQRLGEPAGPEGRRRSPWSNGK